MQIIIWMFLNSLIYIKCGFAKKKKKKKFLKQGLASKYS